MQEIKKLLEDIKQTGEGSLELKIENIVYERRFYRPERLIILGGGHVGQAISKFASAVGFYVIVVDDRPSFANRTYFPDAEEIYCEEFEKAIDQIQIGGNDYVTVVTRGHRFDLTCLRKVLSGIFPRYLGMMGSKRRVAGIVDLLQEEGNSGETSSSDPYANWIKYRCTHCSGDCNFHCGRTYRGTSERNTAAFPQSAADLYGYRSPRD